MSIKYFLFLLLTTYGLQSFGDDCVAWFLKAELAPRQEDCHLKCSVTPVDMGSFSCSTQCDRLCSKTITDLILTYMPRLTEGDKIVISKMPYEAYKAFLAKEKVNKLSTHIFKKPGRKDESDAFRHFVWSVLLAKELGVKKARIFLNAHENDSTQDTAEKKMDLLNNEYGLKFFIERKKNNQSLELVDIEKEALDKLRNKKLKILKPRFKKIPGGYYSK